MLHAHPNDTSFFSSLMNSPGVWHSHWRIWICDDDDNDNSNERNYVYRTSWLLKWQHNIRWNEQSEDFLNYNYSAYLTNTNKIPLSTNTWYKMIMEFYCHTSNIIHPSALSFIVTRHLTLFFVQLYAYRRSLSNSRGSVRLPLKKKGGTSTYLCRFQLVDRIV